MPTGQEDDPSEFWTRLIQPRIASIQGVSHRDKPEVIEFARQKIDREVAAMHAAISSLLTRRNTLSPISSLPVEVLARILHFHAANKPPPQWSTLDPLGWIRATHVCRFWRETALQNPCLWSDITDRLGDTWTDEILARAKSAPISYSQLSYVTTRPGNVVASRVIPHQLFRLRHLSVIDNTNTMASIMQSIADSPAPILESLRLLHQSRMASYVLLPDLFAGYSPRLRQLELLQIQIPWSAPILRGLQHLKIKFPWSEPTPGNIPIPECYSQFFMALKEMPDLRTLYLAYCLPSQSGQVEAELSTNLPFLETLSLYSEDAGGCVGVLKHITFPQSCRVLVGCDDFSPGHVGEMRDLVKAHTGTNTDRPPPLTIFISITDDDEPVYIINVWRTARSPSPVDICPEPDFSLRVSRPNTDELIMTRIAALLRNLWIESISALVVGAGGISWGPFEWIDVFQPYTGLESVRAHKYAALSFCDALRMPISKVEIDQSEDDNTEENLLTKKTLFLDKLKFVELRTVDFSSAYDDEEDDVFHEELKTWLIERKEAAGMLPTFAIRDCSISPDKVKELEEMTEIDWDLVEHMQDTE